LLVLLIYKVYLHVIASLCKIIYLVFLSSHVPTFYTTCFFFGFWIYPFKGMLFSLINSITVINFCYFLLIPTNFLRAHFSSYQKRKKEKPTLFSSNQFLWTSNSYQILTKNIPTHLHFYQYLLTLINFHILLSIFFNPNQLLSIILKNTSHLQPLSTFTNYLPTWTYERKDRIRLKCTFFSIKFLIFVQVT